MIAAEKLEPWIDPFQKTKPHFSKKIVGLTAILFCGLVVVFLNIQGDSYKKTHLARSRRSFNIFGRTTSRPEKLEHFFNQTLKRVCSNAKIRLPKYKDVNTLIDYLEIPDEKFCRSWLAFGGEKLFVVDVLNNVTGIGMNCAYNEMKKKHLCFNKEYEMNKDPCLVYSFSGIDEENRFEKEMSLFSCEVHSFQFIQDYGYEESRRDKFWTQHNWVLGNVFKEVAATVKMLTNEVFDRRLDKTNVKIMPLYDMVEKLDHADQVIKFISSNIYSKVWTLLKQIVLFNDKIDIRQVGVGFNMVLGNYTNQETHELYQKMYQVFEGMACAGYRMVRCKPFENVARSLQIGVVNRTVYPAYEINFVKDLSLF